MGFLEIQFHALLVETKSRCLVPNPTKASMYSKLCCKNRCFFIISVFHPPIQVRFGCIISISPVIVSTMLKFPGDTMKECTICGKRVQVKSMRRHEVTHMGGPSFQCSECDTRPFRHKYQLDVHVAKSVYRFGFSSLFSNLEVTHGQQAPGKDLPLQHLQQRIR